MSGTRQILITVTNGQKKERLDKFLSHQIENTSRTKIKELIDSGFVKVNNKIVKCGYTIIPDDSIEVILPTVRENTENLPENIPIDIIFEDDYLLVINKPAGMVTHPAYGNFTGTLVNALLYYTQNLSRINDDFRPGIVHRIDKGTSGLLVIAKDEKVHRELSVQFHDHDIDREYHALVWGNFSKSSRNENNADRVNEYHSFNKKEKKGRIETFLNRSKRDRKKVAVSDSGKSAITHYKVLEEFNNFSYLKINLETGRTHQIRVHLSHIHHPVLGDSEYGGRKIISGEITTKYKAFVNNLLDLSEFQFLHAKTLGFIHPITKEHMVFDSVLPANFIQALEKVRKYSTR
jgi:23S rRNA pseudouridine1911/1915/1917 synthase